VVVQQVWGVLFGTLSYYLPAYIASLCIVLFWFSRGKRISFKVSQRWLGSNRSYEAAVVAVICGAITGAVVSSLGLGAAVGLGAWVGSCAGSFVKRRLGMRSGSRLLILDQLDFVLGATLLGALVVLPTLAEFVVIIIVTPFLHILGNLVLFKIGVKSVPY